MHLFSVLFQCWQPTSFSTGTETAQFELFSFKSGKMQRKALGKRGWRVEGCLRRTGRWQWIFYWMTQKYLSCAILANPGFGWDYSPQGKKTEFFSTLTTPLWGVITQFNLITTSRFLVWFPATAMAGNLCEFPAMWGIYFSRPGRNLFLVWNNFPLGEGTLCP